ncbi:MAG: enoyl-CoA hydratase-related protein [Acidimicrobiales bacterium]
MTDGPQRSPRDADELVHLDLDAGVATVTLDSPANRNALSRRLVSDLHRAFDGADAAVASGDVRSIVLTHTPPAFCAGADLKERASGPTDSSPVVAAFERLIDAPVPTIAAVSGPARAGGIGLMASCDLVVVRRDVSFALTEVRIGVAAAMISVPIFRRVYPAHLASALLTGEPFTAETARQVGLVTHVTDDVVDVVDRLCADISRGAPAAVAATKRILRDALDEPTGERAARFERMRVLSDELFQSADAAEGMAAFAEKRPPAWQLRSGG